MKAVCKITLFLSYLVTLVVCEDPIVTLPNGQIQGLSQTTARNKVGYYAFMGIPFAAPPVGNLRFQPPQPVANWDGVKQTKVANKICYQVQRASTLATEDCLYLNVYTPVKPGSGGDLPVFVNIYGGSFVHGNMWLETRSPQYAIEEGLVVVSLNYRVGPFGFLSTGDTIIPGNMGLKDQNFALKWVQSNIHLFGGDPSKVTIIGQSAGAASVTYQVLSPQSAGLFRAAIAQSSSALCPWANQIQAHAADIAYGIAAEIDASFERTRSSQELLQFLQSVDASAIFNTGDKYHFFAPVIEVEHDGAMITAPMYDSVDNGRINKVPLLIGLTSEEAIGELGNLANWQKMLKAWDHNLALLVSEDMNITDHDELLLVGAKARQIYTAGTFQEDVSASIKYHSDSTYTRAVIKYAELQSLYTDVYLYQFSYHGEMGGNTLQLDGEYKVGHAEDLKYFWTYFTDLSKYPASDVTTMERSVKLQTNFAKYLNPTPQADQLLQNVIWPKVARGNIQYLDIDTNLVVKKDPKDYSYGKWVDLFETYAKKPLISF